MNNFIVLVLITISFNLLVQEDGIAQTTFDSYDLSDPKQAWILPDRLEEVSGITSYAENLIACVNDEEGVIFIWDTKWASVSKKIKFAYDGDYEGIAYLGNVFYIIDSEGELNKYDELTKKLKKYQLPFEWDNQIEGLCVESDSTLLLVLREVSHLQSSIFRKKN